MFPSVSATLHRELTPIPVPPTRSRLRRAPGAWITAALPAVLAVACAAPPERTVGLTDAPCAAVGPESDLPQDRAIRRRLSRELGELARDDGTATIAALTAQLNRPRAGLSPPADAGEPVGSTADLAARVRESVVIVGKRYKCSRCPNWHTSGASGFLLDDRGTVVTSHHVIDGKDDDTIAVMTADGHVHAVREVLAASETDDVVLLTTAATDRPGLPLAESTAVGTDVWSLGHPAGAWWYLSRGIVARRFARAAGGDEIELLDITADFARGSSGGPIFDAEGRVHGIVRATRSIYYEEDDGVQKNLQMVFKHCAPADAIRALLE